jgi:GAF domain-containing protein
MIWKFFSPPVFDKEEDNFRAKFINNFAWVAIFLLAIGMIPYLLRGKINFTIIALSALILVMFAALYLLRRGNVNASGLIIVILGWFGLGALAYIAAGARDVIIIAYIALGLLASIVVNWRAGGIVILASVAAIWGLALLEANGYFTPRLQDSLAYSRDLSLIFLVITALIYFSTNSLRDAIARANQSEENLRISNQSLQELNQNLEIRVAARTADVETANQRNEKRAKQFEAIAQVARATTTNQNLETLLPNLVNLISNQFGFYHAGIFLLDEAKEFAELRATNSDGGKRMLNRGHKLGIGQTGIVGFVSATGNPRIALDVGADAAFFNNPDLPSTRSEMALPLRVGDEIIGVLDIQSIISNAFQEEDIEVLSTLADQVSIAIQNARSFETSQQLLKEAQRVSGSFLRESWRVLQTQEESLGYQISANKLTPLSKPLASAQIKQAMIAKATVRASGETSTLSVPIRLRDQVIGVLDIRVPDEYEWDADEVDVAEAVAERLSLALEASLLLKSTQRQAEIERITADISTKIGATTQFDSILRTAAEELSRVLGGSDVVVQIQSDVLEAEQAQVKE